LGGSAGSAAAAAAPSSAAAAACGTDIGVLGQNWSAFPAKTLGKVAQFGDEGLLPYFRPRSRLYEESL
jgi:hypothetical protein